MIKSARGLVNVVASSSVKTLVNSYGTRSKNILRNRYEYRNKDGSYKEFNESIQVLPKEFETQDEYRGEKRASKEYEERYKKYLKMRERDFSLRIDPDGDGNKQDGTCKHHEIKLDHDDDNNDRPVQLDSDPYKKKMHQCIFCKYDVPLDYKNTQLLSQFVSQHTGLVYSQEVTGLCVYKYKELEETVRKARRLGLMPFFYKETLFINDPLLFDPYKNNLKSIPNNYDKRKLNSTDTIDDAASKPSN